MPDVIVLSALAPMHREPDVRSEQVSQMIMGETATVLERQGDWFHLRRDEDDYPGFTHSGYLSPPDASRAAAWRLRATCRGDQAVVRNGSHPMALPLMARVAARDGRWDLPDGREVTLLSGAILPFPEILTAAQRVPVVQWAISQFRGTPYQWGGVTSWGVDCSGLVQTCFAARGVRLPRDASQQAEKGTAVHLDDVRSGDLMFFREREDRVTHVAFADGRDTLAHSTLSCGGFIVEPLREGARAGLLRERLVAVRRI